MSGCGQMMHEKTAAVNQALDPDQGREPVRYQDDCLVCGRSRKTWPKTLFEWHPASGICPDCAREFASQREREKSSVYKDLHKRFTYHPPKPGQSELYEQIRTLLRRAAVVLVEVCPDSRELAKAIASLEEASFWANASIARHG